VFTRSGRVPLLQYSIRHARVQRDAMPLCHMW
jgi:hypothetical protein